jgi:hypothetical protein
VVFQIAAVGVSHSGIGNIVPELLARYGAAIARVACLAAFVEDILAVTTMSVMSFATGIG